ncbi:MAG: TIGR02147 family protein [Bdellovibrionia bacterium]
MDLFEYREYRRFIQDWIQTDSFQGNRSKIAASAGCSPSWITRVLSGEVQLTPDQAHGVAVYFALSEIETDYFMLLVDFERAASASLKKRIQSKLEDLRAKGRGIGASINSAATVSEEDRNRYYSSWIYGAVHVACMIQPFSAAELSQRLGIQLEILRKTLLDLQSMGLIAKAGAGRLKATSLTVHLPAGSAAANTGHMIWRNRVIQKLQEPSEEGLHYSGIHNLSKADLRTVEKVIKDAVLRCRKTIEKSPSETLAVLCVDWFEV